MTSGIAGDQDRVFRRQDFLGEGDKVKAMAARLKPLLDASLKEMSLAEMER